MGFEFSTGQIIAFSFVFIFAAISIIGQFYRVESKKKVALSSAEWHKFKLIAKKEISPNTAEYKFELPEDTVLGLPIGQHVQVGAQIGDQFIARSYTPVSSDDKNVGHFILVIKTYPQGNISKYFSELKIGDTVLFKGPKGQMRYNPNYAKNIGMIAGGTGITPMLQIIRAALDNPRDTTKISLIYANVSHDDILLKKELDALVTIYPNQFSVYYVLNNPPESWDGGVGFVTQEHIDAHLPKPSPTTRTLLCGPPPMVNAMKKNLEALGHPKARAISKYEDPVFCF